MRSSTDRDPKRPDALRKHEDAETLRTARARGAPYDAIRPLPPGRASFPLSFEQERMWFLTEPLRGGEKVRITLTCEEAKLVYAIDMLGDVVDRITFSADDDVGGELRFSYLQKIAGRGDEFVSPRRVSSKELPRNRLGRLWLVKLAADSW